MSKFFYLQDYCIRLSSIDSVSKVYDGYSGTTEKGYGYFNYVVRGFEQPNQAFYDKMDEAVAVRAALLEALENDDA